VLDLAGRGHRESLLDAALGLELGHFRLLVLFSRLVPIKAVL
jgi:hypothetical protein